MCNKCEAPSTPLLAMWAQWSDHTYRNATIRDFMKEQHLNENRKYWSHARRHWVEDEKPQKQRNGHDFAKRKAIAHKVASREATTLMDAYVSGEEGVDNWLDTDESHAGNATEKQNGNA